MKTLKQSIYILFFLSLIACGGEESDPLVNMAGQTAAGVNAPMAGITAPTAGVNTNNAGATTPPMAGVNTGTAGVNSPMAGTETPTAATEPPVMGGVEAPLPVIPSVPAVDCTGASAEAPCSVTIQQARSTDIIPAETTVQLEGIISAARRNEEGAISHIVLQAEEGGALSGIWIYVNDARVEELPLLSEGQRIRLTALTADRYDQRQLQKIEALEVLGNASVPLPLVIEPEQIATMSDFGPYFEGVLVAVEGVEVLSLNPPAGPGDEDPTNEFVVTGGLRINDYLTEYSAPIALPAVGAQFTRIVGVLRYANEDFKIEPRYAADLSP